MDLSSLKIFEMMRTNLSYLGERQDVLSQNIANANTPGYEAKDLKPLDFRDVMSSLDNRVKVNATQPGHMAGTKDATIFSKVSLNRFEVSPTGNGVNVEMQVMEASKNNMEYQKTTNIYRKMVEMIKTAIGNV